MKITWLNGDFTSHKLITFRAFVKKIKADKPTRNLEYFRQSVPFLTPGSQPAELEKIPAVMLASGYIEEKWNHYTGLILIEYKRLSSYEKACRLRNQIAMYQQPLMVFIGSSGLSVKVIINYCLPDGSLPASEAEAQLFHEQAYRSAAMHYQLQFHQAVEIKEPVLNRTCRISSDPDAFYNPEALPIKMEQPLSSRLDETPISKLVQKKDPLAHILPGMDKREKIRMLFETCLAQTKQEKGNTWEWSDEKSFIRVMSHYCFHSGIPEENVVQWLKFQPPVESDYSVIRQTVRNVYDNLVDPGSKPCIPECMNLLARTEEFLNRRYEFRRNEIREEVEYREKNSFDFKFKPVTQEVLNDICLNAKEEGIDAWDKDIRRYIYSLRVEKYHPVNEFFFHLPVWDGIDRIRELADTVPTADTDWRNLFYKWFVGMTAQLIKPNNHFANNLVPVLVGGQGKFKSSFYRQLLPPSLQDYYTESINLENKTDAEYQMAQNILIVIDEFDRLNKKYQAELKHLIQKPQVKVRRPHQKSFRLFPRMASFAASANPMDILTDPTGSRRYICIEITGPIDITRPIHYEQLYAQAVKAVRTGEKYWLDEEEERKMQEKNTGFQQLPLEIQYLFSYFRKPYEHEKGEKYSAVQLLDIISSRSKRKFSNTSSLSFARMLNVSGIQKIHTKHGNYYFLIEK